jgi:hypothetical protein
MTRRTVFAPTAALLAAVVVLAGVASAATSATVVLHSCGTIAAAGKKWAVSASGVPCADAKVIVRTLAPRASHVGTNPLVRYKGMGCVAGTKNGRSGIVCNGSQGRKSVIAMAL